MNPSFQSNVESRPLHNFLRETAFLLPKGNKALKKTYLKRLVEKRLEEKFFKHSVLAPHDALNYTEMRLIASQFYGLDLRPSYLPLGVNESGLDVLDILRNLKSFVRNYVYNMNQQFFIEHTSSNGKHLNTVRISSISDSIQTHGVGTLSSCVDFTYHLLTGKFQEFTKLMRSVHKGRGTWIMCSVICVECFYVFIEIILDIIRLPITGCQYLHTFPFFLHVVYKRRI